MAKNQAYYEAEKKIQQALKTGATEINLCDMELRELPSSLGSLKQLQALFLSNNLLQKLPEFLGLLSQLKSLDLSMNELVTLPKSMGQLVNLESLDLSENQFIQLPNVIASYRKLKELRIFSNEIEDIPDWIGDLFFLELLSIGDNPINYLPLSISNLKNLKVLRIGVNNNNTQIEQLPDWIGQLTKLENVQCFNCNLKTLPSSLSQLEHLKILHLEGNPLNPALQIAYHVGLNAVKAYLKSLGENANPLFEAKLVLVGEGNVGKTTLLKALKGKEEEAPQNNEPTTHGVEIDIHGLLLPHPEKDQVEIKLNAWDFGGQDVYRVTHQFFFSRRSIYLLVWEPRRGVQAGQVEDWLNMIRLRVGNDARVLIVSTHCKTGERIARIDMPVLKKQYGDMIVGFYEVDSLVPDDKTGEMVGIAELKKIIAEQASRLEQMGMLFNNNWKAAREELINYTEPRISYTKFGEICAHHELTQIDTDTLAHLMHDLGYIVHYGDDEKLRDDVVLKPEWLTKAIGFVLEDRCTQECEGILPDKRLQQVWHDHPFSKEPRYEPDLYPFFLRLMEKYDVSYRLPEERHASLVAQHVPQVRPELPWLPEDNPPTDLRRIAMICAMEEDPPGLVPWMIVRTHDYSVEKTNPTGSVHSLHWQKGMFLSNMSHGEAMLEKRDREFHVYTQAIYPEYFMNVIQETLHKLIKDNWPGMEGRYRFMVPCPETVNGQPCKGRFNITALRQFLMKNIREYPCQECFTPHSITELLMGFEDRPIDLQLQEINQRLAGLDSRIANYFMAMMHAIADEAKNGPRLFTFQSRDAGLSIEQLFSRPLELHLWCEAEGCQHPVVEVDKGVYQLDQPHEWVLQVAPYAKFVMGVLKTVASAAAPGINTFFGPETTKTWKIDDQLNLAKEIIDKIPDIQVSDHKMTPEQILKEPKRSGILALHNLLNKKDPTQAKLGLHRVATYTGDYRWLCKQHYDAWQPNIPDIIQAH